ncbi:RNA polymerase sigma factor [Caulobacter segnis]|uniref:RNA polymerase sigma factor n=1 Tax=Caulobacter segnis TaxID=88688 RepID=UPI0024102989|nr:DUF6596 domain-containing protein [Caulobacter segnis]MDG2520016.1 RNA polymerase sigma factor [Caulobacter segnis]
MVAALAARFRDLDLAEDAFADTCERALAVWSDAPPRDPAAWLYAAAVRRAVDLKRRAAVRARLKPDLPPPEPDPEALLMAADRPFPDERLGLIFACCHPAIAPEARVALTLRVVCGLSVQRLARAFLVAEPAILQRITRAKRKIRDAGVPFEVPGRAAWPERLEAVLTTLEIAYAQAYQDAAGASEAAELGPEVLRLSGVLAELLPDEPEVLALAALVRFAEARRPARLDELGAMVPVSEQEPDLWLSPMIEEGARLLDRAATLRRPGPRQILAAIHGAHLSRLETGVTPWADIVELYDALLFFRRDTVTRVNRAVAAAEAQGADAGLAALETAGAPRDWLPYQAARAALCATAGRLDEARAAYTAALALDPPPAERLFLQRRLTALQM